MIESAHQLDDAKAGAVRSAKTPTIPAVNRATRE